jgi:hypothetical protein
MENCWQFMALRCSTELFYAMDKAPFFNEVFSMMDGPVRKHWQQQTALGP